MTYSVDPDQMASSEASDYKCFGDITVDLWQHLQLRKSGFDNSISTGMDGVMQNNDLITLILNKCYRTWFNDHFNLRQFNKNVFVCIQKCAT